MDAIKKELKELEDKPLINIRPIIHMHPFLEAVYRPGVEGYPVINPSPTYMDMINAMKWTDYAYALLGTGYISWSSTRKKLSLIICGPLLFGIGMMNGWARLVGLKGIDQM